MVIHTSVLCKVTTHRCTTRNFTHHVSHFSQFAVMAWEIALAVGGTVAAVVALVVVVAMCTHVSTHLDQFHAW